MNSPDSIASNLKKSDPQSTRNRPTKEGEILEKMSLVDFHVMVELTPPNSKEKTRANADIALDRASERGITGWEFTGNKNFARKRSDHG